jgi:internalin A
MPHLVAPYSRQARGFIATNQGFRLPESPLSIIHHAMIHRSRLLSLFILATAALFTSCEKTPVAQPQASVTPEISKPIPAVTPSPAPAAPVPPKPIYWTDELLNAEIKFHNPSYEGNGQAQLENGVPMAIMLRGAKIENLAFVDKMKTLLALDLGDTPVSDLRPLKGLKLIELYLENTKVKDISALKGMPLQKLYLSGSPIMDLGPLEGMPLEELNAVKIPAADLTPLGKSPIKMLWLTDTPVESITALKTVPLVSLTLHRTKVKDLSPLSGTALQRLHIAETPVEDLSPLKGLNLTRLVFTPSNIKTGMDVARTLPLQEIGTKFEDGAKDLGPPAVFWGAYDAPTPPAK